MASVAEAGRDLKNGLETMTHDSEAVKPVSAPLSDLDIALREYVPGSDEEKRLKRKLDRWMIPMLWWMCVLCYVDRNNIVRTSLRRLRRPKRPRLFIITSLVLTNMNS